MIKAYLHDVLQYNAAKLTKIHMSILNKFSYQYRILFSETNLDGKLSYIYITNPQG